MEEKKDAKKYAQEEAKKLRAEVEKRGGGIKNSSTQSQMPYEQLNNIAHQLSDQNMQLRRQLQAMDLSNFFKRLDYLFKVIELAHMFDDAFIDSCVKEVQSSLTITQEESKEESEEEFEEEDEEMEGIHP